MRNFIRMSGGLDTTQTLLELARQPQLWGARNFRTTFAGTPHTDVQDIWLRFNAEAKELDNVAKANDIIWYPEISHFPSIGQIVLPLMLYTKSWTIERLLVTRLPPGGRIAPHADDNGPYVTQPCINRYHVVLQGLPGSLFRTGDETVQMLTGEIWWFNPLIEHECLNNSCDDRIHLLVDLKSWPEAL